MPRRERPVPGLLRRREPRTFERDDVVAPTTPRARPTYGSPFRRRLAFAAWIAWALVVFAVVLAVTWWRPEPLVAAAAWAVSGVLCRASSRLVDGTRSFRHVVTLLGLTGAVVVLVVVGAAFVAAGERA